MNLPEQSELWNRIQSFPLDEPGAAISFSRKLAGQQKWSHAYTKRVIEEYRKFIFLCCISPKGASPSKAVDEAWHLHLTYTKSYWIAFCKDTLGKDIHHHPSKGGEQENHKHEEWYKETLALYQSVFGVQPPDDIWPVPTDQQSWIPDPYFIFRPEIKVITGGLALLPFMVIAAVYGQLWPFSLTGPQFLWFFPLFALSLTGIYLVVEYEKRSFYDQLAEDYFQSGATVFQQAKFLYGKHRAIQAAIVDLIRRNLLEVTRNERFIVYNTRYSPPLARKESNPLMEGFLQEESGSALSYEEIDVKWYREEHFSNPALEKLYLFAYGKGTFLQEYWIQSVLIITGVARVLQGLFNDKPVLYLLIEAGLMLLLVYIVQKQFSRKAMIFRKTIKIFRQRLEEAQLHADSVVAGYAVKGPDALTGFSESFVLASVFAAYAPIRHTNINNSNAACSSCGGSGGCSGGGCSSGCGGCGGD